MNIHLPRYIGESPHRPTLASLVREYVAEAIFTKREAVRFIVGDHLRANVARGKGNAAKRRHRAIIAQNQGRSDRAQNVAAIASARAERLAAVALWTPEEHEQLDRDKAEHRATYFA